MSKLLSRTKELLKQKTTDQMAIIATETGLPYTWIHAVRYKNGDPSVSRVERLYEHLSGHALEVN